MTRVILWHFGRAVNAHGALRMSVRAIHSTPGMSLPLLSFYTPARLLCLVERISYVFIQVVVGGHWVEQADSRYDENI